jgi:hypothetical protein
VTLLLRCQRGVQVVAAARHLLLGLGVQAAAAAAVALRALVAACCCCCSLQLLAALPAATGSVKIAIAAEQGVNQHTTSRATSKRRGVSLKPCRKLSCCAEMAPGLQILHSLQRNIHPHPPAVRCAHFYTVHCCCCRLLLLLEQCHPRGANALHNMSQAVRSCCCFQQLDKATSTAAPCSLPGQGMQTQHNMPPSRAFLSYPCCMSWQLLRMQNICLL